MMTKDNAFYIEVAEYIKKNRKRTRKNEYLTRKNKLYLMLFAISPRAIREVHAKIRGL